MLSPSDRRAVAILRSGCLILLLLAAGLPFQGTPALFGYPISEDGYYALTAARHLGLGQGFSVDGVHLTGGVQPLWVVALASISWLVGGDRASLVRVSLALSVLLYGATAVLVGRFTARLADRIGQPGATSGWTATLLYLASGTAFLAHFNLLETGLVLAIYMTVVLNATRAAWQHWRTAIAFGVACGVLVLARVDAIFFAALLVPLLVRTPDAGGVRRWIAASLVVPAVAALVASPWLFYNFYRFGHLTPSGGLAQAADRVSLGQMLVAGMYLAGRMVPLPVDSVWEGTFETVAAALVAVGLGALLVRRARLSQVMDLVDTRDGRALLLLFVNGVALAAWYGLTSRAWWMFLRYLTPVLLASVPVLALLCGAWLRERAGPALVLVCAVVGAFAWTRYAPATAISRARPHRFFVSVAEDVIPRGARLGAFQSGTLGFFRDDVVNLDGKVNEDALRRRGDILAYSRAERLEWVLDWPWVLERDFFKGPPTPDWELVAERRLPGCASCDVQVFRRK